MKPHTVIAVAIALSFAACSRGPLVTIKNESGRELQNVVLSGSGFSERLPTLPPAAEHSFSPHVRGESGIRVQFDTAGQRYDSSEEGYFEASGGYRVSVVVSPDMKVAVDSGTATPKPESVSIIDVPSERRDYGSNIGNIKVRFSDGHSEVWTSLGRCMYAHVSPTGLVGWTRYTSRNHYGKPVNSILRVRFLSGRIKDFEAYPYIEEWGFADNDSAVIIKARGRDAPAYYVKYSLGTGKLVESVACTPNDQLPKWAQPYAD